MDLLHPTYCQCARLTEELMQKAFKLDIRKALDPLDPTDFLVISSRLAKALAGHSRKTQAKALRDAIKALDIDWASLTKAARNKVIEAVRRSIVGVPTTIIPNIVHELEVRGLRIVKGARRVERARIGAQVGVSLALRDRNIISHLASSQGNFVTDEYLRRAEFFSASARTIVARGLEEGLGQDEIARLLKSQIGEALGPRRSGRYWNVIANVFVGRARTYGQLASYIDAGIERYRYEAILDEVTSDICRMLHGKVWEVRHAMRQYEQVEQSTDPQAIKDVMPWMRVGRDSDGNRIIYTESRSGQRTTLAQVVRSGVGVKDDVGRFSNTKALDEMSAVTPPSHPMCRSTIVTI